MFEKHAGVGNVHTAWIVKYSFPVNGEEIKGCFKRLDKEYASLGHAESKKIDVFYMPSNPKVSVPAFNEIVNKFSLRSPRLKSEDSSYLRGE